MRLNPFRAHTLTTSIGAWGNSAAVRLPAAVMKKAGWSIGQAVDVDVDDDRVVLSPSGPKSPACESRFDDAREKLLDLLLVWARAARQHGDVPVVVRVNATHTTVSLSTDREGLVRLMELSRENGLNALSMAFNVLAVGNDVAFLPNTHQKALIRWERDVPSPDDLKGAPQDQDRPVGDPLPSLNWWWKSHPLPDGVLVILTPATPARGYRVGMSDREGTLGELRGLLDAARWASLGEPPAPLESTIVRLVGALGQAADPAKARSALLDLAAQALVAVESLDAQAFVEPTTEP